MADNIRHPAAAGSFYPADAEKLKTVITDFMASASGMDTGAGAICGIMVPHAGYVYSGQTAAAVYAQVKNLSPETVIILGAGHTASINNAAIVKRGAFKTPLGTAEIDEDFAAELLKEPKLFTHNPAAHAREHSIEVQLPFIQTLFPAAKIVPVLLNNADAEVSVRIGQAIAQAAKGKNTLIVISTDLSHYPPEETARKSDLTMLKTLETATRFNSPAYFSLAEEFILQQRLPGLATGCCGVSAVMAGVAACCALGSNDFSVTAYTNSAHAEGADASRVVGYGGGVFIARRQRPEELALTAAEKKELLLLARQSIRHNLKAGVALKPEFSGVPVFNIPAALFVSLHKGGNLRGCIGSLEAENTMQNAVCELACSAAFNDPRFSPVSAQELDEIKIEISVLSPLRLAASPDEIVPGLHGVLVRQGRKGGTYLPQVWEHFGNNANEFLNSLCAEKAGLEPDAWKKGAQLFVYTATVFGEA